MSAENKNIVEKEEKNYILDLNDRIEKLYGGDNLDKSELLNLIELIKLDGTDDLDKAFENQIYDLTKSEEDKNLFDFKFQKGVSILDFVYNYITASNIIISNITKKEKKKKNINENSKEDKQNTVKEDNDEDKINNMKEIQIINNKKSEGINENNINNNINVNNSSNEIKITNNENLSNKSGNKSSLNSSILFSIIDKTKSYDTSSIMEESKVKDNNLNKINEESLNNQSIGNDNYKDKDDSKKEIVNSDKSNNNDFIKPNKISKPNYSNNKNDYYIYTKDINFENYEDKNNIKYHDDTSFIKGKKFECDTVYYIYECLNKITTNKN